MKCIFCHKNHVIKRGFYRNQQYYFCHDCHKRFSSNSTKKESRNENIFEDYLFHKQTYEELRDIYGYSKQSLKHIIDNHRLEEKIHIPRPIILAVDTTYFGRRSHQGLWGVLVFKDTITKEIVWWKFVTDKETATDYLMGKQELIRLGYIIQAVVGDGFSSIYEVFSEYPIQFCHFHIKQIVGRYIGRTTKQPESLILLSIIETIPYSSQEQFKHDLLEYMFQYQSHIEEKRRGGSSSFFKHKNLRSLLRSLLTNVPYLFTYREYPNLNIPNTTNCLEGFFTHLKIKLRVHRGLTRLHTQKLIEAMLLNSSTVKKK
jgi:hypothetical protein